MANFFNFWSFADLDFSILVNDQCSLTMDWKVENLAIHLEFGHSLVRSHGGRPWIPGSDFVYLLWTIVYGGSRFLTTFFRLFKTMLQISSRNCHAGYTIWAGTFQILFWIGYYLCFSWRLAIVNTHRYLLKSDDFLTSLYNDRTINLPDTLEDAEDRQKSNPENQKKFDKKGTSQKK